MITTVVVTADSKAGNLARIALAARRLGYRALKQSMLKSPEAQFDKIQLEIESDMPIGAAELSGIRRIVPTVVDIQMMGTANRLKNSLVTRDEVIRADARRAASQVRIAAPTEAVKALVSRYGKLMVGRYPDIADLVIQFDDEVPAIERNAALMSLGKGIGRWQYKKKYSLGAKLSLDKTIQRMLWPALSEFVAINREGARVFVLNCPHGSGSAGTIEPDCNFVTGFISGFLNETGHFRGVDVVQLSKQKGSGHCCFEIRPK